MSPHRICPIPGCTTSLRAGYHLMCSRHWRLVHYKTKRRVWDTYRGGRGTSAHLRACREAIDEVSTEETATEEVS